MAKFRLHEAEFLVIRFALGVFMPTPPVASLLDGRVTLPGASSANRVWIHSGAWQLPKYENAETFVERLVRDGALLHDTLVPDALRERPPASPRTVRRRFQQATGPTQGTVRQIERARHAYTLLQQGTPILDAVYEAGYADQPHMTRALKQYIGETPAQILRAAAP
jgi:AraC-like DNA-binding protein